MQYSCHNPLVVGETCYLLFVDLPYSRLFWWAIKLANWSKNVIGEF